MVIKYPTSSSYHFRISIPKDVQSLLKNKKNIQITFNNGIYRECIAFDKVLHALFRNIVIKLRKGKKLTLEEVKEMLRDQLNKLKNSTEFYYCNTNRYTEESFKKSLLKIEEDEKRLNEKLDNNFKDLNKGELPGSQ